MTDITAILTAHREGTEAGVSLRSMLAAVEHSRARGLDVETLVMLDVPDATTRAVFADVERHGCSVHEVRHADQGRVRNEAVERSRGRYLAFLDGDDLWSENWLTAAHALCAGTEQPVIAHPELDWFFEDRGHLFFHADQGDDWFDPRFLRFGNYWDALCLAPRAAYDDFPYADRAVEDGFAYEDWLWNIQTLDAGWVHRVVPDTVHFKRRGPGSQNQAAIRNRCLTRPHRLFSYAWQPPEERTAPR